jgi:hypothetical protein
MRFILMHKTNERIEPRPFTPQQMAAMGALIEEGRTNGTLLATEGLCQTGKGVRLVFTNGDVTVTPGPFPGSNELVSGMAIVRVQEIDEAIDWATRFAGIVGDVEIDIRPVTEPWDLGFCPKPDGIGTRFMIMHKATPRSEAGTPPAPDAAAAIASLVDDMTKAGILLMTESLQPSAKGTRIIFTGTERTVVDGPFAESKELIGGFAIVDYPSKAAAIASTPRFASIIGDVEVDVRPLYTPPRFV